MDGALPRKFPRSVAETVTAGQDNQSQNRRSTPSLSLNPYLAGEVIGDRYRLVRELGSGGMGVVWVAHSLVLGVDVALKLIRASSAGPAVATRMAREAHAAARLGHPALVRVFDFGWTSRGDPFLVMELVHGETLSAVLARDSRIPAIRAVQMLLPVADGLRLAHDKNIVHRDIKPENIFLASDAFGRLQPKLLDFGIAKVDPAATDSKLTQVGVVLGSPEYMSPEQALGVDEVDERTDVWSLSVVLYEMITGAVPFKKPNYNALMQSIIHDKPMPTQDCGAGDAALWLVIERGLAKKRDRRWANMTEFGEALALWLYEHGIKEDLSGNSIRAVWLDGALSGVRVDLPRSGPPGPPSEPPAAVPSSAATVELPAAGVTTNSRLRPKRSIALTLVLGTAVGGVAATAVMMLRPELQGVLGAAIPTPNATPSAASGAARNATPAGTMSAATNAAPATSGVSGPVRSRPAGSAKPEAPPAPVAVTALPLESATPPNPKNPGGSARTGPKGTPTKQPTPEAPAPRPTKSSHDFGF
jgi:serine/threonine protein kinase